MKKILYSLLILFMLVSCKEDVNKVNSTVELSYEADMSLYGLSGNNNFLSTSPKELLRVYESGGSGIFLLSESNCEYCQIAIELINEAAKEMDLTVYYIDTKSEIYPFSEYYEEIYQMLFDTLIGDEISKTIYLPHLFTIENGQIVKSHIGLLDDEFKEGDEEELIDIYKDVMRDFIS